MVGERSLISVFFSQRTEGLPTVSELDAIEAVHSDSVPGVLDILKSITDTFG